MLDKTLFLVLDSRSGLGSFDRFLLYRIDKREVLGVN
jgi:hypothetical protein